MKAPKLPYNILIALLIESVPAIADLNPDVSEEHCSFFLLSERYSSLQDCDAIIEHEGLTDEHRALARTHREEILRSGWHENLVIRTAKTDDPDVVRRIQALLKKGMGAPVQNLAHFPTTKLGIELTSAQGRSSYFVTPIASYIVTLNEDGSRRTNNFSKAEGKIIYEIGFRHLSDFDVVDKIPIIRRMPDFKVIPDIEVQILELAAEPNEMERLRVEIRNEDIALARKRALKERLGQLEDISWHGYAVSDSFSIRSGLLAKQVEFLYELGVSEGRKGSDRPGGGFFPEYGLSFKTDGGVFELAVSPRTNAVERYQELETTTSVFSHRAERDLNRVLKFYSDRKAKEK